MKTSVTKGQLLSVYDRIDDTIKQCLVLNYADMRGASPQDGWVVAEVLIDAQTMTVAMDWNDDKDLWSVSYEWSTGGQV